MDEPSFDDLTEVEVEDLNQGDTIVYYNFDDKDVGAGEVIARHGPDIPKGAPGHCGYHFARVVSHCVQISLQITDTRYKVWRASQPE